MEQFNNLLFQSEAYRR